MRISHASWRHRPYPEFTRTLNGHFVYAEHVQVRDDSVLGLLGRQPPDTYLTLPQSERRWRGRAFLACWLITGDRHYSWWLALHQDSKHSQALRQIIESGDDNRIRARFRALGLDEVPQ